MVIVLGAHFAGGSSETSVYLSDKPEEIYRIMIVDDSRVCLKILSNYFSNLGYIPEVFSDALMAMDHLQSNPKYSNYAAILTDIFMPITDGLLFTEYCRKDLGITVPIIVLSSAGLEYEEETRKVPILFINC